MVVTADSQRNYSSQSCSRKELKVAGNHTSREADPAHVKAPVDIPGLADTVIAEDPAKLRLNSSSLNCEILNVCYFEQLHLRKYCYTAINN